MDAKELGSAPPYDPPPYPTAWTHASGAPQSGLHFLDFLPGVITRAKCCVQPTYEPFSTLVEKANKWLQANSQWKVFTCESIEFACRNYYPDSKDMTYIEYEEHSNFYVRGIRLFLRERSDLNEKVQQIGYLNLCPQKIEGGGIFSWGKFETMDVVVQKFNTYMRSSTNPAFQGRIITIETQNMKQSCDFDPDKSNWIERGDVSKHFVFILRIFYEVLPLEPEEIGLQDFVPFVLSTGGIFTLPEYEPMSNVISRASLWCSQQRDIRICNAQFIEVKIKKAGEINSQRTDYVEGSVGWTCFARILRIAYTKPAANLYSSYGIPSNISALSCRTFMPFMVSKGCIPAYENLYQTKERVSAWVKATGARVISAETSRLRLGMYNKKNIMEESVSVNLSSKNVRWIYVIRLYLDGIYQEPPPEMLPPMPYVTDNGCTLL